MFEAFLPYLGRTGKKRAKDLEERSGSKSNPKTDWMGPLRDNETDRSQQCWEAVHTKSEERYGLECRSVTDGRLAYITQ